jgi:hypothetical protein
MINRGFRSNSAPTPTPTPLSKQTNNNYYIRRPTVVFNDERIGPSDKSSGAQAKVNQKFVSIFIFIEIKRFLLFRLDIKSSTKFFD